MSNVADQIDDELYEETDIDDEQEREIEARARAMGWFPEAEWDEERARREGRQKPKRFLTAAEYIAKTETNLPILRETTRRLSENVAALTAANQASTAKFDDLGKLLENLARTNKVIGSREYERGKADALAARRAAIEAGDEAGVDRADAALSGLEDLKAAAESLDDEKSKGEARAQERKKPDQPMQSSNPAVDAWVVDNPWFQRDRVLYEFVVENHARMMKEHPAMNEADILDYVKKFAQEKFPEKFGINPRRRESRRVGAPAPGGRQGNSRTFADLPDEDKAAFRRHRDYMKERKIDYTEDEFLAGYTWS